MVKLLLIGDKLLSARMRAAEQKIAKESARQTRKAANLIKAAARRNVGTVFATHGAALQRTRGIRNRKGQIVKKTLAQDVRSSVRVRKRQVTARVGSWRSQQAAYGKVHEEGRTVQRKSRSGNVHSATYPKKEWLRPAVNSTREEVFRLIGKTFEVV